MTELTLEERVRRLEDIDQIKKLKNRYHLYINDCQFERVGELFTNDAVVDMGYMGGDAGTWCGREEIGGKLSQIPQHLSQIKQFLHNHTVEVDGDQATGWAFLEARYGLESESYNVAAKYSDGYRRVDGVWLFSSMLVTFYFTVAMLKGWAGEARHQLFRLEGQEAPFSRDLRPNPPI